MRKSVIILALLLALSVGVLAATTVQLDQQHTAVSVTEQTLYGDPEAAAGLRISLRTHCDRRLFWDTTYLAGEAPQPETAFTYSNEKRYEQGETGGSFTLELPSLNFGMSGDLGDLADYAQVGSDSFDHRDSQMMEPAIDVAARTGNGERHTETVLLADYYDYLPLGYDFIPRQGVGRIYSYGEEDGGLWEYLNDYFRIPVPEDLEVQVTVEREAQGSICRVEYQLYDWEQQPAWYCSAQVVEDGVFFGLFGTADFSQVEDGYGLYYMPIRVQAVEDYERCGTREPVTWTDLDASCENICPMAPAGSESGELLCSEDETEIYALTLEDGELMLTVVDAKTREIRQRQETGLDSYSMVWLDSGVLVLVAADESWERFRMQVWLPGEAGLELWLDTPMYSDAESPQWYVEPSLCFDGQRLAIVRKLENYDRSSHQVLIYDQSGLQYAGLYHHSGDDLPERLQSWNKVEVAWVP